MANGLLDFEQRVANPGLGGYIKNDDGSISTHKMAAEIDEDGSAYAFPLIVQMPDGSLHEFSDPFEALDYNKRIGNAKKFPSIDDAINYSRSYKTPEFLQHFNGLLGE